VKFSRYIPKPLLDWAYLRRRDARLWREYRIDRRRFRQHAVPGERPIWRALSERGIETMITKDYHRIEKALALADPKRPFGLEVGQRLDDLLRKVTPDSKLVEYGRSARSAQLAWNSGGDVDEIVSLPAASLPTRPHLNAQVIEDFFKSRRSVRHFDNTRDIPLETLAAMTDLARQTPSVCNRQPWRLYFATDPDSCRDLLSFQDGNRGFGSEIPVVALVTVDLRLFAGSNERNQCWVDGGLFAMSLVWAAHALGVQSCMLNMSAPNSRLSALRSRFSIPEYEAPVVMIGFGYAAPDHRIARSPRRESSEIVTFIDSKRRPTRSA